MKTVTDLRNPLPTPTKENPLCQLEWIFRDKISLYSNKNTIKNYRSALTFYKQFLRETHNYSKRLKRDPRFYIGLEWDVLALHKVTRWIDETNLRDSAKYRTSLTLIGFLSVLGQ